MSYRTHWQLDPQIDFLNHGSFGATPRVVTAAQRAFQDELEWDPIEFLAPERSLNSKLDHVRQIVSDLVGADPSDLAFVRNATEGVNAVLRSLPLDAGDEIMVTNHGYNACTNAADYVAKRSGATVRVAHIPFPLSGVDAVMDAVERELHGRTRLLLIDHVTSPTGVVFPIAPVIELAHQRGVRVLVDGAHGPGMVPLNLNTLDADYYTANHHKWLCGPKVSGLLWVAPQWHEEIRPTVISHAANRPQSDRSRFLAEFDWTGTFDPSPLLALPTAIDFLSSLFPAGMRGLMNANHAAAIAARNVLAETLEIDPPVPDAMLGSLVTVPLPAASSRSRDQWASLQQRLREHHRFELPVFPGFVAGTWFLRISLQAYNDIQQVERLAEVLRAELAS
ncbi:aminotransferase class V-fold PLP-dependent enzyme [Allorhodopirellula heiligendammensis]|uniref:Isopenicillin N epimerase n=1 Tax=Allorhodopirellula heiligendammensis TaxID=2714739 RepID=A0A5C6C6A1_9BACT|nr:aminotransferase class V-fold PLP-dependent enzyme [Allorhodopirellula heiligendammensis]TWU19011.1 Isopenicillin N epimerase [Allorhodopirellula heiligendammensis]